MNLTFEYNDKLYQIELNDEQINRYEKYHTVEADVLISNKEYVRVEWLFDKNDDKVRRIDVEEMRELNISTLIDKSELLYIKLLQKYGLEDDTKSRQLWGKCHELGHSYGLDEVVSHFHQLVELIQN